GATMDKYIRAIDTDTGKELWRHELPYAAQSTPISYRLTAGGKQYLVVAAGGHGALGVEPGDALVACTLGEERGKYEHRREQGGRRELFQRPAQGQPDGGAGRAGRGLPLDRSRQLGNGGHLHQAADGEDDGKPQHVRGRPQFRPSLGHRRGEPG